MFWLLNNAALNGTGVPLQHPTVVLSCAAMSLATAAEGGWAMVTVLSITKIVTMLMESTRVMIMGVQQGQH